MGLFGRNTVQVTEAVPAFLGAQVDAVDGNWESLESELRELFPRLGPLNPTGRVRMEILAASLLIESQAVSNLFAEQCDTVLNFIHEMLKAMEPTQELARAFFDYYRAWSANDPVELRPWDSVAVRFIERVPLPFDTVRVGSVTVMSPIQITAVGALLISLSVSWWKQFSEHNRLEL